MKSLQTMFRRKMEFYPKMGAEENRVLLLAHNKHAHTIAGFDINISYTKSKNSRHTVGGNNIQPMERISTVYFSFVSVLGFLNDKTNRSMEWRSTKIDCSAIVDWRTRQFVALLLLY